MQKVIRNVFSLLVMLVYMVSSIGFGVHECSAKGTKHILLINSDRSCEQIHDHCACNSGSCGVSEHSHNCCSTEIHHLDLAHDNTNLGVETILSCEIEANDSLQFALNVSYKAIASPNGSLEFKHGPPLYSKTHQILATLAQWRL